MRSNNKRAPSPTPSASELPVVLCGFCRHWRRENERYGICDASRSKEDKPSMRGTRAWAIDGYGGMFAVLRSREDFGCVMGESAPPKVT